MYRDSRCKQWEALTNHTFDVAIVGGGINGACLYHQLCQAGYSVALLEKGDFASGTSQASAMMIWGGLLYLRNWDLLTVKRMCNSRDHMLADMADVVKPQRLCYVPSSGSWRSMVADMALYLYWLLGGCKRGRPCHSHEFRERTLLDNTKHGTARTYDEASVEPSDARFVLHWLLAHQNEAQCTMNYCALDGGTFDGPAREWRLDVTDSLLGNHGGLRARCVINAAGVWTDGINRNFGVESPYKHVLSKGVFVGVERDPRHQQPLIFDTRDRRDAMSLIPWGPVSLWGPTETVIDDIDQAFEVEADDVRFLLDELNYHLARPIATEDIISLRCGVRPLVVERSSTNGHSSLALSRKHRVQLDSDRPWISVYGGKLSNCIPLARKVERSLGTIVSPSRQRGTGKLPDVAEPTLASFPRLDEPIPDIKWCAKSEMCWTLEDYLRRRTNVSQWVARGGLGQHDEHLPHLTQLAKCLHKDHDVAVNAVDAYRESIATTFDRTLAQC